MLRHMTGPTHSCLCARCELRGAGKFVDDARIAAAQEFDGSRREGWRTSCPPYSIFVLHAHTGVGVLGLTPRTLGTPETERTLVSVKCVCFVRPLLQLHTGTTRNAPADGRRRFCRSAGCTSTKSAACAFHPRIRNEELRLGPDARRQRFASEHDGQRTRRP